MKVVTIASRLDMNEGDLFESEIDGEVLKLKVVDIHRDCLEGDITVYGCLTVENKGRVE